MSWKNIIDDTLVKGWSQQEIDAFVKQTKQELLKAIDDAVKDSYAPNEQTIYKAISGYASSMTHGWN